MKTMIFMLFVALMALGPVAAVQAQDAATAERIRRLEETVRQQQAMINSHQDARLRSDKAMTGDLETYGATVLKLRQEMEAMRQENAALRDQNAKLLKAIEDLAANDRRLQADIAAEGQARAAADKALADSVSSELNRVTREVNAATGAAIQAANSASVEASEAAAAAERQAAAQRRAAAAAAAQQQAATAAPGGGEYLLITVERGDTLSAIAKAAGVTVAQIKAANNLTSDNIMVGQKLKIPKN